jgi:hypothetical protein
MTERATPGPGGWWPVPDRSVLPTVLGLPPWATVGMAAALTALGVCVDLFRIGALGAVFTVCYVVGCLLAVAWVRRDGLFWALVQPPLLVAVAVPVVVLLAGAPRPETGIGERALVVGAPLVNAFPTMALTTGLTLASGLFRLVTQRLRTPRTGTQRTGTQRAEPHDGRKKTDEPVSPRRGPAADAAP